jgi:acyl-coenzyme A thioesterase PaaI-like protein
MWDRANAAGSQVELPYDDPMQLWAKRRLRLVMNLWPPFLFSGIRVTRLDADFRAATVELRQHWWNRNYVGVHFGGSLYAMTDPFFMLLLIENLGPTYIVWDKAATVRYRKPGRGTVRAEFRLTPEQIEAVRERLETALSAEPVFTVQITNAAGELVAEVEKTVHCKKKPTLPFAPHRSSSS